MTGTDLAKVATFGAGGWLVENALSDRPRYSAAFGTRRVPFLPIYAAGGAAAMLIAPHLRGASTVGRFVTYAAALSALEYVGCQIDRRALGARSWDYGGGGEGCVDLAHAAIWGALGLLVEKVATR